MSTTADPTPRFDVFEPGDKTALVCMDVPEMERLVVGQLHDIGYKAHTGFSAEDLLYKLQAHLYQVLIIAENYGGTSLATNPILAEAIQAAAAPRHRQLVVLLGASLKTGDEMQAFQHSVDLVVGLADIANLRPMLRRAVHQSEAFYARYLEALATADAG